MILKKKQMAVLVGQAVGVIALAAVISTPAFAQQSTERVTVTGSSISRASTEGALPVQTFSAADIERTGATTAQDLMTSIASAFGGAITANNVGATGGASEANLRALGSQYTLVLLNGRRVADFGFNNQVVDLNSIPLAAVERVEVLKDGASSIYGSDAIAGVINFILKEDYQGAEVSVRDGKTKHTGGNIATKSALIGFGDLKKDKYNVMVSLYSESDESVLGKDRDFGGTAVRPDLGVNKSSPRNGIPNFTFTDTLGRTWAGVNPLRQAGCVSPAFALAQTGSVTGCGTDYVKFIDLIPPQKHDNAVVKATFQVSADHKVYAEYMKTSDHYTSTYSPAPYTRTMTYPIGGPFYPTSFTVPEGAVSTGVVATAPAGGLVVTPASALGGTWRTVAGGGRTDITDNDANRWVVGAKGVVAGWDYDAAYSESTFEGVISWGPGKYSYTLLTPLVNAGQINVFGPQTAASQALLDSALLKGKEQETKSQAKSVDFRFSKDVAQLAAGPLAVAIGGGYRKESINQTVYDTLRSGDEVGGGGAIPGVAGERKIASVFAEALIPMSKGLEAQTSARYDKYTTSWGSSFNNFSPKVGLRYQPAQELLFRSSVSTGFRAPSMFESLRPFTEGNNTNGNYSDNLRCPNGVPINASVDINSECNVQQQAASAGNVNLKPEKSKQFSLGLVYSPSSSLSGSIDYWNTKITDAIVQLSEISVMQDQVTYKDNIYRYNPADYGNPGAPAPNLGGYPNFNDCGNKPDGTTANNFCGKLLKGSLNPAFPIAYVFLPYDNASGAKAAGFDIAAAYKLKMSSMGFSMFTVAIDGTLTTKHSYTLKDQAEVSDLGKYKDYGAVPKWRHVLTFALSGPTYGASLTQNYTAGYEDFTNSASVGAGYPLVRDVKNYITYDALLTYRPLKSLDLGLGVKNMLDKDPPSSRIDANFQVGYDATYVNPTGRMIYMTGRYKFW